MASLAEYRAPLPMGVREVEVAVGITRREQFDPELEPRRLNAAEPPAKRGMISTG